LLIDWGFNLGNQQSAFINQQFSESAY